MISLAGVDFARAETVSREEACAILIALLSLPPLTRYRALLRLPAPARRAILQEWWWRAHGGQIEPAAADDGQPWRIWMIMAGRGFGKTRAGAEWVWARAREDRDARIALVAASLDEVERVMIRGESGLLAIARSGERPNWIASRGVLYFPSGAEAHAFTAERPDKLRGPQHHFAWCDELAKWPVGRAGGLQRADAAWDNLMLGLRLGERPRTIVTTTPSRAPVLRRILALPAIAVTRGRTADNPHSAADFRAAVYQMYGNSRLGRQELEGELLADFAGALWTREMLEKSRVEDIFTRRRGDAEGLERESGCGAALPASSGLRSASPGSGDAHDVSASSRLRVNPSSLTRIVIGLDPPASTGGDSCGIVVCGKDRDGVAYVLADLTASGLSPEAWARRVAEAARLFGAGQIVAEKNQGGDMVGSVLRAVDADLPVRLVAATKSKAARAEPIALRFETGRARLAGRFPELEDQLCALTWAGYEGPGSPDRADAMVWAMTELFEKEPPEPRIRLL